MAQPGGLRIKKEGQVRLSTAITESFLGTLPYSLGPHSTHLIDEETASPREEDPQAREQDWSPGLLPNPVL